MGGVVRDLFNGIDGGDQDIDFLVEGNAIEFAELLARDIGGSVKRFEDFVTAKLIAPEKLPGVHELDFASARTETYDSPGKLPRVALSTMPLDLKRRDFSVNAMALPIAAMVKGALLPQSEALTFLKGALIDHFNGLSDLTQKRIRVLHEKSFIDDPTRIFRAARYAARIQGQLDTLTQDLVEQAVGSSALTTISEQRKLNELKKIMNEDRWLQAIEGLHGWGVSAQVEILAAVPPEIFMKALRKFDASQNSKSERFEVFMALAGVLSAPQHAPLFTKVGVSNKRIKEFDLLRQWIVELPADRNELKRLSAAAIRAGGLLSDQKSWNDLLLQHRSLA